MLCGVVFSSKGQTTDSLALRYGKEIKSKTIEKHLRVIASDEYEGRETGKPGQKRTMEYLINQFASYGIKDVKGLDYRQPFPLIEQENKNVSLVINGIELNLFEDFIMSPFFLMNEKINGELQFHYKEIEISKNHFFVWPGNDQDSLNSRKKQIERLREGKAKTIIYHDPDLDEKLDKYGHYYRKSRTKLAADQQKAERITITLSDTGLAKLMSASKVKQKKIDKKGRLAFEKKFPVNFVLDINKPNREINGDNVIAYIKGSEKPRELIVITAHYDHLGIEGDKVYNGADDDGTGTVSLLEIAQSFSLAVKEGHGPKRSILIMPVSGEEKGLLGSKYYTDNPVFPLEQTVANLNIDMIGRYDENHEDDSNYVYLIGSDKLSNELHELSEAVNQTYSHFNLDYRYNEDDDPNRFYYRSDHYNFAKNNIPVIFYFSGVHDDYHKPTDTVDKIDFDKTTRIARLVFYTAWELANRENRIKLKPKP